MARLEVEIDGSGARRGGQIVERSLDDIRRKTDQTSRSFDRQTKSMRGARESSRALGQAIGSIAVLLSARQVLQYAEAYTTLQNRLKLVTDSTAELTRVSEELFTISQGTRASYESTAELFSRVARASDTLGKSQQDVLDVTESVANAIRVSGVSADSANAAIVQLGQGLASGALRGDELRSVLEQTPRLARAIADGIGITVGQLREYGAEGKLSAEAVFNALQTQGDALANEASRMQDTLGTATTVLNNSFTRLIGRMNETVGFTANVSSGMITLARSMDTSVDSVEDLAFGFTQLVRTATLSLTTIDNRFERFQNTLVGTIATIFRDDDVAEAAANQRVIIEQELQKEMAAIQDFLADERAAYEERKRNFEEAAEVDLTFAPTAAAIPDAAAVEEAEKLAKALDKQAEALKRAVDPAYVYEQEWEKISALLSTGRITQAQANIALNEAAETLIKANPEVQAYNDQLERGKELTESLRTPQEEYTASVSEYIELLNEGAISQETFARAVETAYERSTEALEETTTYAERAAENIQDSFADFLFDPFDKGLEGMLDGFADTLRRMAAEAAASQILGGLGGSSAFGSFFDFIGLGGGIPGFANGTNFAPGGLSIVGERGPELLNVPRGSQVINNNTTQKMMGGNVSVTVNVTSGDTTSRESANQIGLAAARAMQRAQNRNG